MNVVIIVLGKAKHTRDIKIWLWDFASLKFVWRAEKTLVASKGGSETESETCLYNSLGQFVLVLIVVPPFIEGGWHNLRGVVSLNSVVWGGGLIMKKKTMLCLLTCLV